MAQLHKVVGIDPGKDGAACFYAKFDDAMFPETSEDTKFFKPPLDDDGQWDPWQMNLLAQTWHNMGAQRVVIEECHAFPGISAAANASVMEAYGMWMSALAGSFRRNQIEIVGAATWKKAMNVVSPVICTCGIKDVRRMIRFSKNPKTSTYSAAEKKAMRELLLKLLVIHDEEKSNAYERRKALSLKTARERFPLHPFKTPRGRDLDGEAEAALIALYGAEKI